MFSSSRIHFAPTNDVVLYSAVEDVEDGLPRLPTMAELQDCINTLAYRDPLGQAEAVASLALAPHVFEDSPLSSDIFANFRDIFLESPSLQAISVTCNALHSCAQCFSPGTTIRYIVALTEAIQARISYAHSYDKFENAACSAIIILVECVEKLLVVLSRYPDYVGPFFSDFSSLGSAFASLFDMFARIYNFYHTEIVKAFPRGGGESSTQQALPANHISLLHEIADQISHWVRCAAAIPFACEAVWEYYSSPAVIERLLGAMSQGSQSISQGAQGGSQGVSQSLASTTTHNAPTTPDDKCASALLDILLSPALIDMLYENGFLGRLLSLDYLGACKHVLQSEYVAEVVLAEILPGIRGIFTPQAGQKAASAQRLAEPPGPLLDLFLACLSVLDGELLVPALSALHPSAVRAVLQRIITNSTLAAPRREFIFAGGRRIEVLENDESHSMNTTIRPRSPEERALKQGVPPEYLQPETTPIRILIYDLFLSRLEDIQDFPYAPTIIPALLHAPENTHSRHGVPHTLARILSAPCFAKLLSHKAQETCFRLLSGTAVAMMSVGLLEASSPCLRGSINLAVVAAAQKQVLELQSQVADNLRSLLATKSRNASLTTGDALTLMLLPSYFLFGAEREMFVGSPGYGEEALQILEEGGSNGRNGQARSSAEHNAGGHFDDSTAASSGLDSSRDSGSDPHPIPESCPDSDLGSLSTPPAYRPPSTSFAIPLIIPGKNISLPPILEVCFPWSCLKLEYTLSRLKDPGQGMIKILKAVRPFQGTREIED